MAAPQALSTRLIGALFVERGLVSESQVRVALEIQRETGQQLGQVLVERFGVSRKELASVVAEQWAKLGGSAGPEDTASWRRLGEIFVDRGFVTQEELDQALVRQRQTGERLGEALVAQGVISKFELAGALAEQMASLGASAEPDESVEPATVHQLPARDDAPQAATPDNVVELALPRDTVDEETPAASVPPVEAESVPVETGGDERLVAETGEVETADVETAEAPMFEAPEPLIAEVETAEAPTSEAPRFEAPEPVIAEVETAELPWTRPAEVDSFEAPVAEPTEADVLDFEVTEAEPEPATAFEAPEPEIAQAGAAALPWGQPAEVDGAEVPSTEAAEPDTLEVEITEADLVRAGLLDAPEAEISVAAIAEQPEPKPTEVEAFEALVPRIAEVGDPELPEAGPAESAVFATDEGALIRPELVDEPAALAEVGEVGEPQPAELLMTDLRDAIPVDAPRADEPPVEAAPLVSCIAFAPTTEGYRLVALDILPEPGETIDVPDVGERVVLRVGRSPIPADTRRCAYVEEPVTAASVGVAVH